MATFAGVPITNGRKGMTFTFIGDANPVIKTVNAVDARFAKLAKSIAVSMQKTADQISVSIARSSIRTIDALDKISTKSKQTTESVVADQNKIAKGAASASDKFHGSWWQRFGTVALGFTIAYRAMNLFENGLRRVATLYGDAIRESGEYASLQAKLAMLTVMHTAGVITFSDAFARAAVNVDALRTASITSMSTLEELSTGVDEIAQTIGVVPASMMKGVASLIDFTVMVAQTTGSTTRQIRQELQALLSGQIRTTDQLIRTMKHMGVITQQDIADLKAMTNQVEIFERIVTTVAPVVQAAFKEMVSADVTKAQAFWQKQMRFTITEAIRLASEMEGVSNIFGEVFYNNAIKFQESMSEADWNRTIFLVQKLRDTFQWLIDMFEATVLFSGKVVTAASNLSGSFFNLSLSSQSVVVAIGGFVILRMVTRILETFGRVITLDTILALTRLKEALIGVNATAALTGTLFLGVVVYMTGLFDVLETKGEKATRWWGALWKSWNDQMKAGQRIDINQMLAAAARARGLKDTVSLGMLLLDVSDAAIARLKGGMKVLSDAVSPFLRDLMDDINKALIPKDIDAIWGEIDRGAQGLTEGLGFVDIRAQEAADSIKKYTKEIETMADQTKVLDQIIKAIKAGIITPDEIVAFKRKAETLVELNKVPESLRLSWKKHRDELNSNQMMIESLQSTYKDIQKEVKALAAALKKEADQNDRLILQRAKKEVRNIAKELKEQDAVKEASIKTIQKLTMTAHEYAIWSLNDQKEKAIEKAHGDVDIIKQVTDAHKLQINRLLKDYDGFRQEMENMSKTVAKNMESAFSEFFFDAFTGELKTLADYVTSFVNSIYQVISDVLAKLLVREGPDVLGAAIKFGVGVIGGVVGGGGSYGLTTNPDIMVAPPTGFQHGGWIPESVIGVGKSGRMYTFAEHGPEYVNKTGAVGGSQNIIINNNTGQESSVAEQPNMRGGRDVVVTIGEMIAGDIRSGGVVHREIRRTFGGTPVIRGR